MDELNFLKSCFCLEDAGWQILVKKLKKLIFASIQYFFQK